MKAYAGIDLHSSNNYIGIINEQNRRLYGKRLPNDINHVLMALEPFKDQLESVVVESTYNWYWLVDGMQEQGYNVRLANPAAIQQYQGLKHTDDKWDAFWLAHLRRLNILPEGYIYPKERRAIKDLLRRRLLFVRNSTSHILSLQSMITRNLGIKVSGNKIKKLTEKDVDKMFNSPNLIFMAQKNIAVIQFLKKIIADIRKNVKSQVKIRKEFKLLQTIIGIGDILGLTIMLEVDDISRFSKVGDYSSYCRCVKSERISNGKKKNQNNKKNGNKYLSWAYVEAAHFMIRNSVKAHRFYQKKKAERNGIVAMKAIGNKICRASYYIMRDHVPFDEDMLFR